MGYNRSGTRRLARLKRRKRHEARLLQKVEAGQGEGMIAKAKHAVQAAAEKVGDAVQAAAQKVKEGVT
jgi:hypothetical protein